MSHTHSELNITSWSTPTLCQLDGSFFIAGDYHEFMCLWWMQNADATLHVPSIEQQDQDSQPRAWQRSWIMEESCSTYHQTSEPSYIHTYKLASSSSYPTCYSTCMSWSDHHHEGWVTDCKIDSDMVWCHDFCAYLQQNTNWLVVLWESDRASMRSTYWRSLQMSLLNWGVPASKACSQTRSLHLGQHGYIQNPGLWQGILHQYIQLKRRCQDLHD